MCAYAYGGVTCFWPVGLRILFVCRRILRAAALVRLVGTMVGVCICASVEAMVLLLNSGGGGWWRSILLKSGAPANNGTTKANARRVADDRWYNGYIIYYTFEYWFSLFFVPLNF